MVDREAATERESGRLDGWKEIAAYLNCDVRTCIRWEKDLGLPVLRVGGDIKRSRVFAAKADIDAWLSASAGARRGPKRAPRIPLLIVAGGGVGLAVAALLFVGPPRSPGPAYARVNGMSIAVYDVRDRYLWNVGLRSRMKSSSDYEDGSSTDEAVRAEHRRFAFADVDGDGRNEMAAFLADEDPLRRAIGLFDDDGRLKWSKTIEFVRRYRGPIPGNSFKVIQVSIADVDGDGRAEILALAQHVREAPSILLVYDLAGRKLVQYDHTGVIHFFKLHKDSAPGGPMDILLAGTNNLCDNDAVLAVLDGGRPTSGLGPPYSVPGDVVGDGSLSEDFVPLEPLDRADQKAYFRFRRNALARFNGIKWMYITELSPSPEGLSVQVKYGEDAYVYFYFDREYHLLRAAGNSDLERSYPGLRKSGIIPGTLESYVRSLLAEVRAWNGESWDLAAPAPGPLIRR